MHICTAPIKMSIQRLLWRLGDKRARVPICRFGGAARRGSASTSSKRAFGVRITGEKSTAAAGDMIHCEDLVGKKYGRTALHFEQTPVLAGAYASTILGLERIFGVPLRESDTAFSTPSIPNGQNEIILSAGAASNGASEDWFMTPIFDSVQYCLQSVHAATGLPWYLTIIFSTLIVRGSFIPLITHQLRAGSRYATAAKPEADKLWNLYKQARDRNGRDLSGLSRATSLYWQGLRAVLSKHNCRPMSMFGGSLIQLPAFLTFVVSMRHMIRDSELRSDLAHGGALWFQDLTVPDETLALPMMAIGLTYMNLEMSLGKAPKGTIIHWLKDTGQVLLIAGMPLTTALPQGIFLYWITSATFSAAQTRAVRSDGVRAALGLPVAQPGSGATGNGDMRGGMPTPRQDWFEERGSKNKLP